MFVNYERWVVSTSESSTFRFVHTAADNRDIVCADAVVVLVNNHRIKSPQALGIVVGNHFLSTYSRMEQIVLNVI